MTRRAIVAWRRENAVRKIGTQENCGPRKEFAAARIRMIHCAGVIWLRKGVVIKDCTRAKVERATQRVGRSRRIYGCTMKGKCGTKDLGGKRPKNEEGNNDRHGRVALKTTITSGKKSIGLQYPQEDPKARIFEASKRNAQRVSRNKEMGLVER
jgi:hypothetical protein